MVEEDRVNILYLFTEKKKSLFWQYNDYVKFRVLLHLARSDLVK